MSRRYVLAPQAVLDLVNIWRYIKQERNVAMADRVEAVMRKKIRFLASNPGAGHWRKDLTDLPVKFFAVYSFLIVYHAEAIPLQVVSIIHAHRDVKAVLEDRT
jgi:plasmid stabilization system protein ParE